MDKNHVKAELPKYKQTITYTFRNSHKTLFTENDTNKERIFKQPNDSIFVKDAFHDAVIDKENIDALVEKEDGTKFAPVYEFTIKAKGSKKIFLRLSNVP